LADQIPAITEVMIGMEIEFNIRVEFGGEIPPDRGQQKKTEQPPRRDG
jgi:hypothetical protein